MDASLLVQLDRHRPWLRAASVAAPVGIGALLALFRSGFSTATAVLVLVVVVVAASSTGDRVAGLLAAVAAGVSFDVFLTEPYGTLAISSPDDIETLVLLVVVGIGVTELALWGRRQQAQADRSRGHLEGVLSAAEIVASRDPEPDDFVALVGTELTDLLGLDRCHFTTQTEHRTVIQPDGSMTRAGRHLDVRGSGLPTDDVFALPVRHNGIAVGAFVLTSATRIRRPRPEELRVAVLLADQVGNVLRPGPDGRTSDRFGTDRSES